MLSPIIGKRGLPLLRFRCQSRNLPIRWIDDQRGAPALDNVRATIVPELVIRAADVRFDIPIIRLPAGEYLLTFEATLEKTTARRDLRFTVR